MSAVPPEGTIGILGGGQLGRMLALAAARLGLRAHIFAPEADPCAADVAAAVTRAAFDDEPALAAFAASVDVVTTEFENVPAATARFLARSCPVYPSAEALEVAQDRVTEKVFLNDAGIATAPWRAVDSLAALETAIAEIGPRGVLKTRRLGYDGKGQARLDGPQDAAAAFDAMAGAPAILEGFVDFACEISVIAVRGRDGAVRCYDPGENRHAEGILRETSVPAGVAPEITREAVAMAGRIVEALDYVGVLGVEMFVGRDGALMVNEIAPRVHNTGHWTLEGCAISQFENHIRAVAGLPLGRVARHSDAVMTNLIGDDATDFTALLAGDAALHLYRKGEARPGRKMGHVTRISPRG